MRTEAAKPYSRLTVVLGPTNTGKTHRAITRMLEHPSGMLGLPLRLLAREVYDRITRELGEQAVALVTGEEKRIGARARYWVCTVEAMPPQEVDFLAVDEVQLAAHPQRGHVFTDRLLKARGRAETWFLGADTIRSLIPLLLPTANIESHARLSTLRGKGQSRMGALPSRSAVVAFNIPDVYRIAEQLRHRRGGAAVVHGGLSPRARNAQVALYEAQEVDYLVATDAIGMGLNLNIRHVAFAGLRKFDGREDRPLLAAELGQIAGRAGRYLQDGSFGTLAPVPALPEGLRRSIEEHRFEKLGQLTWRNSDLDLSGIEALLVSLHQLPARPYFSRTKSASDVEALERLARDPVVSRRARGEDNLGLLWQVCQIPDYRQSLPELHTELVKEIFLQLTGPAATIDESWLGASIRPLDDIAGDIDALTARIASVRTWTYLSNHSSWVPNARHWIERTRDIEDRLSDALHERLVERFVERRRANVDLGAVSAVRAKERSRARASSEPEPEPGPFAALQELRLRMGAPAGTISTERWVEDLVAAPHERFRLDASGHIFDDQRELGRLSRGNTLLRPALELTLEGLDSGQRLRLVRRLSAWSRDLVNDVVGDLNGSVASGCSPAGRGLLYQLEQNLGSLPAHAAGPQVAALTSLDHDALHVLGVRFSRVLTFVTSSLRPRQRLLRLALARVFAPRAPELLGALHQRVSMPRPPGIDAEWLCRVGFVVLGPRAIRIDVADRVSNELARQAKRGAFELPPELAQWLGCSSRDAAELAIELGYRRGQDGAFRGPRRRKRIKRQQNSSA